MRWLTLVTTLLLGLASSARVAADPGIATSDVVETDRALSEALDFRYQGSCVERSAVERQLRRWLRSERVSSRLRFVVSGGDLPAPHARFDLLRDGTPSARRELRKVPGGCPELTAALALSMALAVDVTILERMASNEEPVTTGPPPGPAARDAHRAPALPAHRSQLRVLAGAGVAVLVSVLPSATVGGQALFGLALRDSASISISALGTLPSTSTVGTGSVESSLLALWLELCAPVFTPSLVLYACADAIGGRAAATGQRYSPSESSSAPYASAGASFGITARAAPALRLSSTLLAAIARPVARVARGSGETASERAWPAVGGVLTLTARWGG
jgi:hypothetical protein